MLQSSSSDLHLRLQVARALGRSPLNVSSQAVRIVDDFARLLSELADDSEQRVDDLLNGSLFDLIVDRAGALM